MCRVLTVKNKLALTSWGWHVVGGFRKFCSVLVSVLLIVGVTAFSCSRLPVTGYATEFPFLAVLSALIVAAVAGTIVYKIKRTR